jgi:hypothetical protein
MTTTSSCLRTRLCPILLDLCSRSERTSADTLANTGRAVQPVDDLESVSGGPRRGHARGLVTCLQGTSGRVPQRARFRAPVCLCVPSDERRFVLTRTCGENHGSEGWEFESLRAHKVGSNSVALSSPRAVRILRIIRRGVQRARRMTSSARIADTAPTAVVQASASDRAGRMRMSPSPRTKSAAQPRDVMAKS